MKKQMHSNIRAFKDILLNFVVFGIFLKM